MKLWLTYSVAALLMTLLAAGCGGDRNVLRNDVGRLQKENTALSMKVQTLQAENTQMARQVDTLAGMEKETRLQSLDTLASIRINKRTGLYDLDEDGTAKTLRVYIEPRDSAQDTVKAVGRVHVELWNLNANAQDAKLAAWTLEPEHLHTLWGGTIFSSYYRLTFEIAEILHNRPEEMTIKVTFTDYLSGKVFTDQTVIRP